MELPAMCEHGERKELDGSNSPVPSSARGGIEDLGVGWPRKEKPEEKGAGGWWWVCGGREEEMGGVSKGSPGNYREVHVQLGLGPGADPGHGALKARPVQ